MQHEGIAVDTVAGSVDVDGVVVRTPVVAGNHACVESSLKEATPLRHCKQT